eukprot:COSAG01_NODE_1035_length_11997_cov_95.509665_14_plen_305_part_00
MRDDPCMRRDLLARLIGGCFHAVGATPGVRSLVGQRRFEGIFRRLCSKQEPLEGWPATMALWDRWRLLGRALQNNCEYQLASQPLGLRVLRQPAAADGDGGCAPDTLEAAAATATVVGQEVGKDPPLPQRRLRIFSLNMWLSHFLGGPRRSARLQLLVDHLEEQEYDLCVFQELFSFGLGPLGRMGAECVHDYGPLPSPPRTWSCPGRGCPGRAHLGRCVTCGVLLGLVSSSECTLQGCVAGGAAILPWLSVTHRPLSSLRAASRGHHPLKHHQHTHTQSVTQSLNHSCAGTRAARPCRRALPG